MKSIIGIAVLICSLLVGQTAFSFQCGEGLHRIVEKMNLDSAQKEKIKPILEQLKADLKTSWSQMKDLHTQVSQQVQSDSTDQAALDSLIDKKAKLIGDMMKAKANAKHQIYLILNEKQKATYKDMVKKVEEKMAAQWEQCKSDKNE